MYLYDDCLPLAITNAGTPLAAIAEHKAYRFWATFTRLCHLRYTLVGANMCPPLHMLPNAPWPDLWVPPPRTRGIRATARPVPHDSALVWWPKNSELVRNSEKDLYNNLLKTDWYLIYIRSFFLPASRFTQYGWRWFLATSWWMKLTMSGLMGALNTAGKQTGFSVASLFSE